MVGKLRPGGVAILAADRLIRDLFAANEWLGWLGLGVLAVLVITLIALGIREIVALSRLRQLDTWQAVLYRRQTLRLVDLEHWAGVPAATGTRHVVVAGVDGELFGFIVGQVRAREEVVIKPLGLGLRGLAGLAGATVTGEGKVALIVDFPGVVRAYSATQAQQD